MVCNQLPRLGCYISIWEPQSLLKSKYLQAPHELYELIMGSFVLLSLQVFRVCQEQRDTPPCFFTASGNWNSAGSPGHKWSPPWTDRSWCHSCHWGRYRRRSCRYQLLGPSRGSNHWHCEISGDAEVEQSKPQWTFINTWTSFQTQCIYCQ